MTKYTSLDVNIVIRSGYGPVATQDLRDPRSRFRRRRFLLLQPAQPAVLNLRSGRQKDLEDRQVVDRRIGMNQRPSHLLQHRSAVSIDLFQRSASAEEQLDRAQMR